VVSLGLNQPAVVDEFGLWRGHDRYYNDMMNPPNDGGKKTTLIFCIHAYLFSFFFATFHHKLSSREHSASRNRTPLCHTPSGNCTRFKTFFFLLGYSSSRKKNTRTSCYFLFTPVHNDNIIPPVLSLSCTTISKFQPFNVMYCIYNNFSRHKIQ